jgi:SAM-dependent methyltransferase
MAMGDLFLPFINDAALGARVEPLRAQVASGARGRVLEVGAGTGLNFHHYPDSAFVTAIDPLATMRKKAEARARKARASVEVLDGLAGSLPAEDASVDTVLLTFVLCSVKDVAAALAEARRVLRPGGEIRILEHVKSERRGEARLQRLLDPVWRKVFGGCSLLGDPRMELERAGFDAGALVPVVLPLPPPVRAGLMGVAVRR